MDKKNVYRNWTAERWNLFSEIQIDPVTNFMILFKQKAFKKVFHKGNVWGETQARNSENFKGKKKETKLISDIEKLQVK